MKINGKNTRTIWLNADLSVGIIDQTKLPFVFSTLNLNTAEEAAKAISEMWVRGAPLIGIAAAYGMALGTRGDVSDRSLKKNYQLLLSTRPTAINLKWALDQMMALLVDLPFNERKEAAYIRAAALADADVATNSAIGDHGLEMLKAIYNKKQTPLNILTHCNAGWLATVDWGTAMAPIYKAFGAGIPLHIWVDETRPRNQGASLTAQELNWHGISHTVIADNTGGHLMQHGMVDLVIVGADRVTRRGDVCNKIGTYLKALAAKDNGIPFYVAMPFSTFDFSIADGIKEIPIEIRSAREVTHISGKTKSGEIVEVQLTPDGSNALNYGFDVTPSALISGLITERGICRADEVESVGLLGTL